MNKTKIITSLLAISLALSSSSALAAKKKKKKKVATQVEQPVADPATENEVVDQPLSQASVKQLVALKKELLKERAASESYVESGIKMGSYTGGIPNESGVYTHLNLKMSDKLSVRADISAEQKFGTSGNAVSVGATYAFNEDWYADMDYTHSPTGNFNARSKFDYVTYYKGLLENKTWVLGGGFHSSSMKDGHSTTGFSINNIYYSDPFVVEGIVTRNLNDPGNVTAMSYSLALTYTNYALWNKKSETVLYLEHSTVGYQDIGTENLVNYSTNIIAVRDRTWIGPDYGVQVSGEYENNQYYKRKSLNLGVFKQF